MHIRAIACFCLFGLFFTACGGGGSNVFSGKVLYNFPPIVSLTVSPSLVRESQTATLQWNSLGAKECTATGAWSGALPLSGSIAVTPLSGIYDYRIECTTERESAKLSALSSLQVNAPYTQQELIGIPLFVDPLKGNDSSDGGLWTPLRSVQAASNKAAILAAEQNSDVTVFLRDGIFQLATPWNLNASHSAPPGHMILFRNFPGELPIISSGERVTGWKTVPEGRTFIAHVAGKSFREFYVNRKWARRASYPNVYDGEPWLKFPARTTALVIPTADVPVLQSPQYAEMAINNYWMEWRAFPDSLTHNLDGTTTALAYSGYPRNYHHHVSYYWQNAKEFIDIPGEWFFDPRTEMLTYNPRPDESPQNLDARVPTLETLVRIDGASNLMFYGIDFSETGWNEPTLKRDYLQRFGCLRFDHPGESVLTNSEGSNIWNATPGAVEMRNASHIHFERNRFYNLAANAVVMREGVNNLSFEGNAFSDIGDTAVCIGVHLEPHPVSSLVNRNIDIRNNQFTRTGNNYYGGSGVVAFYATNLNITRNEFINIPGWGVNVGWRLSKNFNQTQEIQENTIANNRFDNVTYWIADSGVIHTKGINLGNWHTQIHDNVFENIGKQSVSDIGRARGVIYLDNDTANVLIANNVMSNIHKSVLLIWENGTKSGNSISLTVSDENAVRSSSGISPEYSGLHTTLSIRSFGDAGLPTRYTGAP